MVNDEINFHDVFLYIQVVEAHQYVRFQFYLTYSLALYYIMDTPLEIHLSWRVLFKEMMLIETGGSRSYDAYLRIWGLLFTSQDASLNTLNNLTSWLLFCMIFFGKTFYSILGDISSSGA